jgi:hypothetical protein
VKFLNYGVPDSFSDMSASTLLRWVRADAAGDIGSNGQKLAQLIDVATQRALQPEIDSEIRAVFREAALGAIGIARITRALPAYYCNRRELRLRTSFMRRGNWGDEWRRGEGQVVFEVFLGAIPVGIDFIETYSPDWSEVDPEIKANLRLARQLFKYLEVVRPFLASRSREAADRWVAHARHLP